MGVVEALDLVPERIDLRGAVGADLLERGLLVNQLAVFEDRHEQLACLEVIDLLALPGRLGVEDGHFVAVVHRFVVNAQVVRDGLARVAAVEAVELLEVRRGDLADVLADLDLGDYIAVLILYGDELVDAAEHRLAARGDEPLADAERIDLRVLHPHIADDVLVERVGNGDGRRLPAGLVEHFARLAGKVGDVAAVEADTALGDALRAQHLVKGADGVWDAGVERVVGVHQHDGVAGIKLAVGLEGVVLGVEHLHPGVGHRAERGHAVELVRDGAGRADAAADVGGACADDGGVRTLRPAGAKLQHRPAAGGTVDAVGLRGDQALVIDGQQREGLDELRLDGGRAHNDHRLLREHGRPLRHGVNIAGEAEGAQIFQKFLAENALAAQVRNVLLVEVQILDIVDQLVEAGGNGVPASVRHRAEINVEIGNAILEPCFQVTIAHSQLVEVAEHGHIELLIGFHSHLIVSRRGLCRAL